MASPCRIEASSLDNDVLFHSRALADPQRNALHPQVFPRTDLQMQYITSGINLTFPRSTYATEIPGISQYRDVCENQPVDGVDFSGIENHNAIIAPILRTLLVPNCCKIAPTSALFCRPQRPKKERFCSRHRSLPCRTSFSQHAYCP